MPVDIGKPLPFSDLELKPPLPPRQKLTEEMQQTLALLTGFDGSQRRIVKTSQSGVLFHVQTRVKGVLNLDGADCTDDYPCGNIKTTEVLVIAHPENISRVWIRFYAEASEGHGVPLEFNEHIRFTIDNLKDFDIIMEETYDQVIVVYSE